MGRILLSSTNSATTEPNLLQLLHFTLLLHFVLVKHQLEVVSYLTLKFLPSSCNYEELLSCSRIAKRKREYFTLLHWWIYSFVQWNQEDATKFLKTIQRTTDIIKNQNLEPFLVVFIYATAVIRLVCSEVKGIPFWN